jgi:hypothetical protein
MNEPTNLLAGHHIAREIVAVEGQSNPISQEIVEQPVIRRNAGSFAFSFDLFLHQTVFCLNLNDIQT